MNLTSYCITSLQTSLDYKIWVTSDLHLNHYSLFNFEDYNLAKNKLTWIKTLDEYNRMIINAINQVVGENDILYILGDIGMGSSMNLRPLIQSIHGRKILIYGNHDHFSPQDAISFGFIAAFKGPMFLPESQGKIILSHYPAYEALNNPYVAYNVHGHIHNGRLNLPQFINANIAENNYSPILLNDLIKKAQGRAKKRQEDWLEEWYAPYQKFNTGRSDLVLRNNNLIDLEASRLVRQNLKKKGQ